MYGSLDAIENKVRNRQYRSEYDFQVDIIKLGNSIHDGHLYLGLDLATQVFTFYRSIELAAVSADGLDVPQVYVATDLIEVDDDSNRIPTTAYTPSPVIKIDGKDVVSFLLAQSTVDTAQDPDAAYNANFLPFYASGGNFGTPTYYPGAKTIVTFANGTTTPYDNYATVGADLLEGVETGEDAYNSWIWLTDAPAAATSSVPVEPNPEPTSSETTRISKPLPTVPGYPYPAIKHSADSIAGYFLNDSDFKDVAVIRVDGFDASDDPRFDPKTYQEEFQMVEQKFLEACAQLGKKKLIVDLQGNGGGYIDSGTDFFAQLFPTQAPNSKSNMRATGGMEIIVEQASANVSAAKKTPSIQDDIDAEYNWSPFAWQSVVTPDMKDFTSVANFYGPVKAHGGKFTHTFQNNYTDPHASDYNGEGVIITGYNNRMGFRQPFNPKDIIVLYDGYCHSTCTVVSEYLKKAGVQFVVIGGRPQTGAMQAVGGVKGAQVFGFDDYLYPAFELFQAAPEKVFNEAVGTMWENWTDIAWQRSLGSSVNGRNHFRIGDDSETPLQFVYEAADCRLWYTREMLYDPVFLWNRVAQIAFEDRSGKQFKSKYCVKDSTGHPTSISGGWKKGTLGPQSPPIYAKATLKGWTVKSKAVGAATGNGENQIADPGALNDFKKACKQYEGNKWLFKVMCGALSG